MSSSLQPTVVAVSLATYTAAEPGVIASVAQQNVVTFTAVMAWVYIAIGSLGILTNVCVIYVIATSKHMRHQVHNVFLLNQSAADLWSSIFVVAGVFKSVTAKLDGWQGELVCRVWLSNFPLWLGFVASLYNLVALSIERYFEIVHPIKHKLIFNRRKAALAIVAVWMWSLVINIVTFIPAGGVKNGACYSLSFWFFPGAKQFFGIFNISVKMLVPIGVFVFSYYGMARSLNTNKIGGGGGMKNQQVSASISMKTASVQVPAQDATLSRARRNIIKTLVYAIVIHVASWSLNQFLFLAFSFGYDLNFTSVLYSAALAIVYLSTCSNPIIYALKYERFRRALRDIWVCKRTRTSPMKETFSHM